MSHMPEKLIIEFRHAKHYISVFFLYEEAYRAWMYSKKRWRKYNLFSTQEFCVTNLQLNKLHNKTLQNQVSVMVSLMRLRDGFMMPVFLVTILKLIFVSLSSGKKDFCSFVQ